MPSLVMVISKEERSFLLSAVSCSHCFWLLQSWQGQRKGEGCCNERYCCFNGQVLGWLLWGPPTPCHFGCGQGSTWVTTCALAPVSQWCHWSCSGCLRRQPAWVAPSQAHSERVTLSGIPVIHRKALRPPPSGSALLWQRCPCLALPLQAAPAGLEGSIHTRAPLNWLWTSAPSQAPSQGTEY